MISIQNPADCCGCSACASICNHNAITMKPDSLGFLYPEVNLSKCVDCGLCDKVCAFNDDYDTSLNFAQPISYGARHKDLNEVIKSRSGAVFVALSDYILENNGIIYGAGYTDHFRVVHKRATTKEARDEFRGSKYVQSDMNSIFIQVKKDLKDGKLVLFSGTPCQTSGLANFIGRTHSENLILVDLVCHGVPSPYIWRDYILHIEHDKGTCIKKVDFRDKVKYGWAAHYESYTFSDTTKYGKWYTNIFSQNIMLRHSCGTCHFSNTKRPSDITIADFWGWQKQDTSINQDDKGLNLVLCNTDKGLNLFEAVKKNLVLIDATPEAYMQPNLIRPSAIHRYRMKFEMDYKTKGFDYIYNHKYYAHPLWYRVLLMLKRCVKRICKL